MTTGVSKMGYEAGIPLTCLGVSLEQLNPRQRMAVISFFENGGNETEACKVAGYSQPNKASGRVFGHRDVKRIVAKIQRRVSRQTDLRLEDVMNELAKAVRKDIGDLVDDEGNIIVDPSKLPESIRTLIDSVEIENGYSKGEDGEPGEVYVSKIKYKAMTKGQALDMALKVLGGYAPEKSEKKVTLDWDQHLEPPSDSNRVEVEIEAEYERIEDDAED